MPMSSADGQTWITYNGESYNAAELRAELERRGHSFRTTSDTEVVLHLYQEYGERFVEKLRGMFAFAIWDARERKLILGRDRLGHQASLPARIRRPARIRLRTQSAACLRPGSAQARPSGPARVSSTRAYSSAVVRHSRRNSARARPHWSLEGRQVANGAVLVAFPPFFAVRPRTIISPRIFRKFCSTRCETISSRTFRC